MNTNNFKNLDFLRFFDNFILGTNLDVIFFKYLNGKYFFVLDIKKTIFYILLFSFIIKKIHLIFN